MNIRPALKHFHRLPSKISWLENGICFGSLALLALIPLIELILRQFHMAIPDARGIINHLFLAACLIAAMLTTKSGGHISITAVQYIKSEKVRHLLVFIGILITVFLLTILSFNSISFIRFALAGRPVAFLTDRIFAALMPVAYTIIALRFALSFKSRYERVLAFTAILFGVFAALPAIAKIIWGFEPPEPFFSWVNFLYDKALVLNIPVIIFLILAGLAGMPIFAVIGGIAMIMLMAGGREPEVASIQIYSALTDTDIIAIPLFTLSGFFLSESKAGERLVRTFRILFGWLPGGMIIATVVICAFFTSFTGASGVTILALGGILFTILSQNKYSERFSIGLLTSAGGMGLMFPPSLPIILVASTSMTILHFMNLPIDFNIIHFFIGAIIPGLILMTATVIAGFFLSAKVKIAKEVFNSGEALQSLKDSFFEILLPFILIAGYFSGTLTLVEASALSVVYVVIIEVFVKKDISIADIPKVFSKAVPIIGGVLAILAMAKALSYAFIDSGVPESFTMWMQSAVSSRVVFLLLLNLGLLALGCIMDIFSAILVFLPLVVPLGYAYGIDPVHLGIIFIINLEAGFLTPPVGMNLFLASYRFEKPFMKICSYVWPFLIVRLIVVLLVTYIPWLTTWLIGLFG
jgi:tripartite ATP-independent transporter DctM subunit